jgi:outer membrane immunogenic protein
LQHSHEAATSARRRLFPFLLLDVIVATRQFQKEQKMKKTLALVALMANSVAATAQDWSGGYAGLTVGQGRGDTFVPSISGTGTLDSGEVYGLFAGYNLQRNNVVYGAELAYQSADIPNAGFDDQGIDRLVDLKTRVGYSAGASLVYGVVGYSTNRAFVSSGTSDGDGLSLGVGFDYKLKDNFIIGAEYLSRQMQNDASSAIVEIEPDVQTFSLRAGMRF